MNIVIPELEQKFTELYGAGDYEVYFAPGRVNLIGEHTDYNGGHVFPCARERTVRFICILQILQNWV